MAKKNLYVLVPVNKSDVPRGAMLKIRNPFSRNTRKLNKRLSRLGEHVVTFLPNGTMVAVSVEHTETLTVKRDAERAARKTGRKLVTLSA